jgi:hypothetical protein
MRFIFPDSQCRAAILIQFNILAQKIQKRADLIGELAVNVYVQRDPPRLRMKFVNEHTAVHG